MSGMVFFLYSDKQKYLCNKSQRKGSFFLKKKKLNISGHVSDSEVKR